MLGFKVEKRNAQKAKQYLMDSDLFNHNHVPFSDDSYLYFPIIKEIDSNLGEVVDIDFKSSKRETITLKEALVGKLTDEEFEHLKTAFDTVGDIAILEIDDTLIPKEQIIAKTLLDTQKSINVVCKKVGIHGGTFRTQNMKILAGEDRLETMHVENKSRIKLNVEDVYFSPRLSTERKRINKLVKPGEEILVMFSGCGVYPINLSKNTKAKHIVGVEINPEGHRYALENIKLNKVSNVEFYNGDVNEVLPTIDKKFDRILMPLPKTAADFLDVALSKAKVGTIFNFYDFLHEDEFHIAHDKIKEACERNNIDFEITETVKCGQHAPRVYRICVDFIIKAIR